MAKIQLQEMCERGQQELMQTRYLQAVRLLSDAETIAWEVRDFDTLSRLYLPLQEARRQIRQRCGEGVICLHLLADNPDDAIDVQAVVGQHPDGQMLIAGWGTIQPALQLRETASTNERYLETFLAAVYPIFDSDPLIVILPLPTLIPPPTMRSVEELRSFLPAESILLQRSEIPADAPVGNAGTFAGVMALWERLHTPYLKAAAAESDPVRRMETYRLAITVDPACELAHQFLADIARSIARQR